MVRRLTSGLGALPGLHPHVRSACFAESGYALFDLLAVATANARLAEAYRGLAGEMPRIWSMVLANEAGPALASAAGSKLAPRARRR
ncbi:hypothetical protein LY13_004934 [Prauserella aidingensis]|nr:hypothetical protein [Prauserella aidingensis]